MSQRRNQSLDLFKLLAAFGVVMVHLAPSSNAAELMTQLFVIARIPFFILISLYFFVARARKLPLNELLALRPDRILVPFFVWTFIYTVMRMLKYHLMGTSLQVDWIGFWLFGGSGVQLYFLPLLLLFQAETLSVILLSRGGTSSLLGICIGAIAVVFGYFGSTGGHFGFNDALQTGLRYTAAAFILNLTQSTQRGRRLNFVLGLLTCILVIYTAHFGHLPVSLGIAQGPLLGYGFAAGALTWQFNLSSPSLRPLLTCSYGIYLAHFGFLEAFDFVAEKFDLWLTPYSVGAKLVISMAICLCCYVMIQVQRKHWLTAYLFIGETKERNRQPVTCGPGLECPAGRGPV